MMPTTTLTPITAVIPDFTVTPAINTPTFPEDIDQYNSELPAVIDAQQATSTQINTLLPQLNALENNVMSLESSTLSASQIALSIANFKGQWLVGTSYPFPSSVVHEGIYYAALQASLGQTPPNATYWSVVPGGINDTAPSTETTYSGSYIQALHDEQTVAIANLASASGAISNTATPVFSPLPTTATDMAFTVVTPSTNSAVFTFDDTANTITLLKNGSFNFTSSMLFSASTADARVVSFDIVDTSDDSILGTQTVDIEISAGTQTTVTRNTLLTVGSNGIPEAPLTIKIMASVDAGATVSLLSFNSTLITSSIVNENATAEAIHASPAKSTPDDADEFGFLNSVASVWTLVKMTWAELKIALAIPSVRVARVESFAVSTVTAGIPNDNTIPQISEGVGVLSLAYTPKAIGEKIRIDVNAMVGSPSVGQRFCLALFKDAGVNAIGSRFANVASSGEATVSFTTEITSDSLTPITFSLRLGSVPSGTVYFNGDTGGNQKFGGTNGSSLNILAVKE